MPTDRPRPVHSTTQRSERPQPHRPEPIPTVWLDFETGAGLDNEGRPITPIIGGRRRRPQLVDLLETARHHHARDLVLCGVVPAQPGEWLLPNQRTVARGGEHTPGWVDIGHYLEDFGMGRFRHEETQQRLNVRLAREWFPEPSPEQALDPAKARSAWESLTWVVQQAIKRDWPLMRLPAQTGLNIWKLRAPESYGMEHLDPDIGQEIQENEPQHRFEHYVEGPARCGCGDCLSLIPAGTELGAFAFADGRFMFHGAPPKELGAAPAWRLTRSQAANLFATDPWHPARYRIRFTVPAFWNHVGMFPVRQKSGAARAWHWPNRPGSVHETWADSREVNLAAEWFWQVEILEGVQFTKAASLQPFAYAIGKMLELAETLVVDGQPASPRRRQVVASAIRHMYRTTIGSLARRSRTTSGFATDPSKVPAHAVGGVTPLHGGWIYQVPTLAKPSDADTWHPEIAARVWATSRVQVLSSPTALVTRGRAAGQKRYGALEVAPEQLIGIQGDALYTGEILDWTLPEKLGGGDDGRSGRIRLKGVVPGPLVAPVDWAARQRLSHEAEQRGWTIT